MKYVVILLLKVTIINSLTCEDILEQPLDKKLTLHELQSLQPKEIIQCLAHLSREKMAYEEAEFIWRTIIMFYDGILNIPDSVLMILHWVTTAVTPEDYANITLSNIEVIQNFGLDYKLNQHQLSAIVERVREDFAGKEPRDYTYYDLSALKQILCAFNRSEIEQIHPSAYRESAVMIGKLERCSKEVLLGFGTLAMQKSAFGPPNTWSDSTIKILGKVAELFSKELSRRLKQPSTA